VNCENHTVHWNCRNCTDLGHSPFATSQTVESVESARAPASSIAREEYLLGPNDQIKLWTLGLERDFRKTLPPGSGGAISISLCWDWIPAAGLSSGELNREPFGEGFREMYATPRFPWEIIDFGSHPCRLWERSRNAGRSSIARPQNTRPRVIAMAGGVPAADAGPVINDYASR
jgi:hypothetical protein